MERQDDGLQRPSVPGHTAAIQALQVGEEFAEVGGLWVVGAIHGGGASDHPIGAMLGGGRG